MIEKLTQKGVDAVTWATWGIEIAPARGKSPFLKGGFNNATTNIHQIVQWWLQYPDANIAARPGHYHVVIDVDTHGGGMHDWKQLTRDQTLPPTLTCRTGSGGMHLWYKLPYIAELNRKIGKGIDIQARKQCLIMPGSIHPDNGNPYRLIRWHDPNNLPTLPKFLWRHVFKPPKVKRRIIPHPQTSGRSDKLANRLISELESAQSGSRNDMLNRVVFTAVANGLDITESLTTIAEDIGLPEHEIRGTVASATRAGLRAAKTA